MTGYIGDGVPDSGRFTMDPSGMVRTSAADANMLCIFYKRAVHNEIKSAQAGMPIYEDMDYVRIQQPGEVNQVVDRPAQHTDKQRWPAQWQAYAAGKDQVAEGTPLGLLFPRHPSAVAMLQALGIMTVQHLANASATAIQAIGMHGQEYVNYAQKYLNAGAGGAAFHQMQKEVESTKRDNERLAKMVDDLQHQVQSMNAAILDQAGVGRSPMPGIPRQPGQPAAQPLPGGSSMPAPPSFSAPFDAQVAQINAGHPMGPAPGEDARAPTGTAQEALGRMRRPGRPRKNTAA